MTRARKIAITVDAGLLARAERLRRSTDESRSAVFSRALRALLGEEERQHKIARYIEVHREQPETAEEIAWIAAASAETLADLPWEEE
jgi:metal-responsive CopG/Arc/MetJ family transcriptional regulator